jgi:hypothetical protein
MAMDVASSAATSVHQHQNTQRYITEGGHLIAKIKFDLYAEPVTKPG